MHFSTIVNNFFFYELLECKKFDIFRHYLFPHSFYFEIKEYEYLILKTMQSTFFKDFSLGLKAYKKAFRFLFTSKFWMFLLIPLALNILLIVLANFALSDAIDALQDYVSNKFSLSGSESWWGQMFEKVVNGILWLGVKLVFYFSFLFFGGYIIIICISPVFSILSEQIEKKLTGKDYPFEIMQLLKDVLRGVRLALRNLFFELLIMIVVFIGGFVPVIGWFGPLVLFVVSAYFYGFSFMDYSIERQRLNVKGSIYYVRQHKGLAVAIGSLFACCLFIPWLGITIAGFFSIVSVTAASIAMSEIEKPKDLTVK